MKLALAGLASIGLAAMLGQDGNQKSRGRTWVAPGLEWVSRKSGNHWAVIVAPKGSVSSFVDSQGTKVSLISANLMPAPGGGSEVVDVRWVEDARMFPDAPFNPEAIEAARRFGLKPA